MTNQSLSLSFVNIGLLPPKKNRPSGSFDPAKGEIGTSKWQSRGVLWSLKKWRQAFEGFFRILRGEKYFQPIHVWIRFAWPRRQSHPIGTDPPVLSTKLSNEWRSVVCYCSFCSFVQVLLEIFVRKIRWNSWNSGTTSKRSCSLYFHTCGGKGWKKHPGF